MDEVRRVRVHRVLGYARGEEVDMPVNRALDYTRNGQAEPVGWSDNEDEKPKPLNRMLDTSEGTQPRRRRRKRDEEEQE